MRHMEFVRHLLDRSFFLFVRPKAATCDGKLDDIIGSHVHDLTKGIVGLCRVAKEGRDFLRGMFRVSCPG